MQTGTKSAFRHPPLASVAIASLCAATFLTALGFSRSKPRATEAFAPSVQCVRPLGATVHKKYRGTDDVEARLKAGVAVRVMGQRSDWRKITYPNAGRGAFGWVEARQLDACGKPSGEDVPVPKPVPPAASDGQNCLFGCPRGTSPANLRIDRAIYSLSANPITKFADWAAYRVRTSNFGPRRDRDWRADPDLPETATLEKQDYADAPRLLHIDRGHQVPLAAFEGSPFWRTVNYLSNITPQSADLNQGAWMHVEELERHWAPTASVYVITGPLYERAMSQLPKADEPHRVPSGYWKVIATFDNQLLETLSLAFDQTTDRHADFCDYQVTIDRIERRSGLELFPDLGEPAQARIESEPGTLRSKAGCN